MTNGVRELQISIFNKTYVEKFGFKPGKICQSRNKMISEKELKDDMFFIKNIVNDFNLIIMDIIKNGIKILSNYSYIPYTSSITNFIHACEKFNVHFPSQQGKIRSGKRKPN